MKRLLLPLLAALALPTAVNAEELIELKPINPHSYLKSSLVNWESNGKRYLTFKGTTELYDCFGERGSNGGCFSPYIETPDKSYKRNKKIEIIKYGEWGNILFEYSIDCNDKTYNREGDNMPWTNLILDQTPFLVAQKYCPIEEWSKLPNK